MKKILIIAIVLMLTLSVCACANGNGGLGNDTAANASSTVSTLSEPNTSSVSSSPSSDTESADNTSSTTTSVESKPQHTHTFSDATCKLPAKCSCGKTQGEPLEHIFSDAVCILCDFKSLNSTASHGEYQTTLENKDGTVTKINVSFFHDTQFIMVMGMKYSPEIPDGAGRQTPTINYNGKQYYYCEALTLGEGEGYNLDITDTTVTFDSYDSSYHFVFEFTGDSFIIKASDYPAYPVGTEIPMITNWH